MTGKMKSMIKSYWKIYKSNILLILLCGLLIVSYFAVRSNEFLNHQTDEMSRTDHLPEIVNCERYSQKIQCDRNGLYQIKLCFSTFSRINFSNVTVSLSDEKGKVLQTWNINCSLLNNCSYYTLALDKRIADSGGNAYCLGITSDAVEGQGISIWCSSEAQNKGLFLNERDLGRSLCYQLVYKISVFDLFSNANGFHAAVLFILACILILLIPLFTKLPIEKAFIIIWIVFGVQYLFSGTLFRAPDEEHHFFRAYEVSYCHAVSDVDELTGAGGRALPLDVDITLLEKSWQSFSDHNDMESSDTYVFKKFSNTSLYSPISYLPQATGIFIARHITNNVAVIAYAGRIANWICITVLLYISMLVIPAGKEIIALVALMPMNLFESTSLAPDGMAVAVSILMVSYVLNLRYSQKTELKFYQIGALYILAWAISLLKIVYLPLCLLYFLIPSERFGKPRNKFIHLLIMAILAAGSNLWWLLISKKFLVTGNTNAAAQLEFILHNPLSYIMVLFRTVFFGGAGWVNAMIGSSLAELNVGTVGFFVSLYICAIAIKYARHGETIQKKHLPESGLFAFVIFSIVILTFTSLYLQWTPPYNSVVNGVQGRYFIPLMLPLYFVFHNTSSLISSQKQDERMSVKLSYFLVCINVCSCIALLFSCMSLDT